MGSLGRSVAEVARELGCDWHTVNDVVVAYGAALVDDPDRIGAVDGLGLDETLFCPNSTIEYRCPLYGERGSWTSRGPRCTSVALTDCARSMR